jgi:type IV pilus assembly protein PilE
MKHLRKQGFTLIEMMVVVAIIGILATIAYPSYRDYIIRGRIPEGLALLSNERITMEKYLGSNLVYLLTPGGAHACTRYPVVTRYFSVTCVTGTDTPLTYTLQATGINSMTGFNYTIDQAGNRTTQTLGAGWGKTVTTPQTCWVLKSDPAHPC